MTDAKFTAGPWLFAAKPSSVVGWPVVASGGRSIASVAYVRHSPIDPAVEGDQAFNCECRANGQLIAAAPDLYDNLRLCDFDGERARSVHAPEDPAVAALCEAHGYGAVMDAAARLWFRKDPIGAFVVGPCAASGRAALRKARGEVGAEAPSHRQHGTGETQLAEQARAQPHSNPEGLQ